jgi:PKD repeat protein
VRQSTGDARNRWGDYSAAVTDPADDTAFWVLQEYAAAAGSTWATWWGHLAAEPPVAPTAHFAVPARTPSAAAPTRFHDTSTGGPIAWSWNFGDGTTSKAQDPEKLFAQPGTYRVALTVSNRAGTSTSSTNVMVLPAPGRDLRRVPQRTQTPREVVR